MPIIVDERTGAEQVPAAFTRRRRLWRSVAVGIFPRFAVAVDPVSPARVGRTFPKGNE
ncbi:MAG: hypothetical protein ACRDD1_06400 [Planctomycetia bacterium]